MDKLLEKLMVSKKIMDKHNEIKRGESSANISPEFEVPVARYNISEELLQGGGDQQQSTNSNNVKMPTVPTVDAIKKSKLPDEIKRLMMEHPIEKPDTNRVTISNELVEKASRLMKNNTSNNYTPERVEPKKQASPSIDNSSMKSMIKEAVKEVLGEYGLLTEGEERTNEIFNFRVGKHLFEGKVTKIKKLK
jgi:hypothetical protein